MLRKATGGQTHTSLRPDCGEDALQSICQGPAHFAFCLALLSDIGISSYSEIWQGEKASVVLTRM